MTKDEELIKCQAAFDEKLKPHPQLPQEQKRPEIESLNPYVDSAEFKQKIDTMERALQETRELQEFERQARIETEVKAKQSVQKQTIENRIWQIISITIGLLTLIATIFGLLK